MKTIVNTTEPNESPEITADIARLIEQSVNGEVESIASSKEANRVTGNATPEEAGEDEAVSAGFKPRTKGHTSEVEGSDEGQVTGDESGAEVTEEVAEEEGQGTESEESAEGSEEEGEGVGESEGLEAENEAAVEPAEKRINELTAKTKWLEQELATKSRELDAKLAELNGKAKKPAIIRGQEGPPKVMAAETVEDLDEVIASARNLRAYAMQNLDGAVVVVEGKEIEIAPEKMRSAVVNSEREIEAAHERKAFLQAREQQSQDAERFYPQLRDQKSNIATIVAKAEAAAPWIKNMIPDYKLFLARFARGYLVEIAEMQARKATAATAKPPVKKPLPKPQPRGSMGQPVLKRTEQNDARESVRKFAASGGEFSGLAGVLKNLVS